ncbi:hypothetical protein DITRI_Ditri02bG0072000 [Diplodiscus trichospermus]
MLPSISSLRQAPITREGSIVNFGPSFKDANEPVAIHLLLQERGKQSSFHCQRSEGKWLLDRISSHYDGFPQQLSALEEGLRLGVPVPAFLAANVLLLFVALMGTTVGSIFLLLVAFTSGP